MEISGIISPEIFDTQNSTEEGIKYHERIIEDQAIRVVGNLSEVRRKSLREASERKVLELDAKYQRKIQELDRDNKNQRCWLYVIGITTIITSTILFCRR